MRSSSVVALWASFSLACASAEMTYDEPAVSPPSTAPTPSAEPATDEPDGAEPPSATATKKGEDPALKRSRLAEKLLAGWAAWHGERKVFAVVSTYTEQGKGAGVIGTISSEADAYESQATLCAPGAPCNSDNAALVASTSAWLGKEKLDGALALELSDFKPALGFATADVGALGGKLVWKKDHFDLVRGLKAESLPKLDFAPEFKPNVAQATATPDGALVLALFQMDPGQNAAKGFNAHVDIKVLRVP
ncbi:MAG: hypothetical protein IPM79_35220 [Polyangiaceae bacterium]|jgi:hypothetical protein|nr:hypothetical protein [Polyangiaceae bacterium]MBK8942709.1 hypothetical protein [Polyangiaceae bacterium]